MKDLSWDIPIKGININYIPDKNELKNVEKIGNKLGKYIKE